jgi:hypothetical protein
VVPTKMPGSGKCKIKNVPTIVIKYRSHDSGSFFRLLVSRLGEVFTVSGVFEDLKIGISEGYKQN